MYFIAAGEVEIELKHERVRLGAGQFFGEIAVLRRARRSATATALSRTSLLVLDAHDLHVLMEREPRIAERMHEMVRDRLGRELVEPARRHRHRGDRAAGREVEIAERRRRRSAERAASQFHDHAVFGGLERHLGAPRQHVVAHVREQQALGPDLAEMAFELRQRHVRG